MGFTASRLKDLDIIHSNQVWATDITFIRLCGFAYLVAVSDWFSRFVLSWRLSNSLEGSFCIEAIEQAIEAIEQAIEAIEQAIEAFGCYSGPQKSKLRCKTL